MSVRAIIRVSLCAALLAALAGGATSATAKASPGWRITTTVGTATKGERAGWLTATSATDAFTSWQCVQCSVANRSENFIEHWTGSAWQLIAIPASLNYPRTVVAIGASSASNLWAFADNGDGGVWNGTAWTVSKLPSWVLRPDNSGSPFAETAVFSPGDAWVFSVGAFDQPTLAAHDVKGVWRKVTLPAAPVWLSAVAANDMWMTGTTVSSPSQTVAMHWTGSAWQTLALPAVTVPAGSNAGYRIMATSPASVWLDRTIGNSTHTDSVALLHWTGTWQVIKVPFPASDLGAMAQDGAGGLWMLANQGFFPHAVQYLYHFGAQGWTRQTIPAQTGATNILQSLAWIPGTSSLWAAGGLVSSSEELGAILKDGP